MTKQSAEQIEVRRWLAILKRAGRKINTETAEVVWCYQYTLDPYGINPELSKEYRQVGREYFARSPGSDIWVWFGDLAAATADALWKKHKASLAFPAGLPPMEDHDASVVFGDGNGNLVVEISESIKQQAARGQGKWLSWQSRFAKGCNSGDVQQFVTLAERAEMIGWKHISISSDGSRFLGLTGFH
jgi:hypothetical protein